MTPRPEGPRPWIEAPIDPERALRALRLTARVAQPDVYRVTPLTIVPTSDVHWVYLGPDPAIPLCSCADHAARELVCKHALAALYERGDARALQALGAAVMRAALDRRVILIGMPPDAAARATLGIGGRAC